MRASPPTTPGVFSMPGHAARSSTSTRKACAFSLGVSADDVKSHKAFAEKFHLPFSLLADPDKKICKAFDVIKDKNMYGKIVKGIARTTFVIGPEGKIQHIFNNVKAEGHAAEVLEYLKGA